MRRILFLVGLAVAVTGCDGPPFFFADGSWFWPVSDHSTPENSAPGGHSNIFGCMPNSHGSPSCYVNPNTDAMVGQACAYHPDGVLGCKGLEGVPPWNTDYSYGNIQLTGPNAGDWAYRTWWLSKDPTNFATYFDCVPNWPCQVFGAEPPPE